MRERIKFHADEHISGDVISALRRRGMDVTTTAEEGLMGASDEEHVAFANRENRVILTHDADFVQFHRLGVRHQGICYVHQSASVGRIVQGLSLVHQVLTPQDMKCHIEFL